MRVTLNMLKDNPGARKKRKLLGRGIGSGKGKTSGRGGKGQTARSGGRTYVGFEGGQTPIYRRLPKRGFNNPNRKEFFALNIGLIQKWIDAKSIDTKKTIDAKLLKELGLIKGSADGIKLLAKGEIKGKITIEVDACSESAKNLVEKAGGKVQLVVKTKAKEEAA